MDDPGESDLPYPPRFRWFKRLSLLGFVLLVGLGGLRAWWGRHADQLLAAEHAAMRAAGHPVEPAELNETPLPAERNAAAFILKAIALREMSATGPHQSSGEFTEYPPFPPAWHKLAGEMVAANGPVFPLLREARAHDAFDWGMRLPTPASAVLLPHLNQSRGLCNFLTDAALREHASGNDAAALELIRDARHVSRAVGSQPFLVSHLVSTGCDALALHRLQVIAAGMTLRDGEDFPIGSEIPEGPATRGQVRALVGELLRPPPPAGRMGRALAGERVFATDLIRSATARNPVLRPLFALEERRGLASTRWYAGAAAAQTWPDAQLATRARRAAAPAAAAGGNRLATAFSSMVAVSVDAALRQDMRAETSRRLAAVSLAVQLFRADHGGQWPASLDALVPAYLPAVPVDPFALSGERLQYVVFKNALPFGRDRPVVFSVAEDGGDQTSPGIGLPPLPEFGWVSREVDGRRDLVRWHPLPAWAPAVPQWLRARDGGAGAATATGPAPTTAPGLDVLSPEAVEGKPDEADEPRDEQKREQR
jgi:hypothetical protein